MPTREEWYFAAKGGLKSLNYKYAGSNNLDEVAWYYSNSGRHTHEVGLKKPNELGLYDMNGNVDEFCEDQIYDTNRVSSGGSFFAKPKESVLTFVDDALESPGNGGQGFRIICIMNK